MAIINKDSLTLIGIGAIVILSPMLFCGAGICIGELILKISTLFGYRV